MIIDRETFTEVAVTLKKLSDEYLATARAMTQIAEGKTSDDNWRAVIEQMMKVNDQIVLMEQLLRAVMDANVEERKEVLPC